MKRDHLDVLAEQVCERARKGGAQQAAATIQQSQQHRVVVRDGQHDEIKASVSRSLSLRLYVDGRFAAHTTNDLRPQAVSRFVDDALRMTRLLMPEPRRGLPDPTLYAARSQADLQLFDVAIHDLTMPERKRRARAIYEAARAGAGASLISAAGGWVDGSSVRILRQTNGFADAERSTSFRQWGTVAAKDPAGRKPSDWAEGASRKLATLADPASVGQHAARRALALIGASTPASLTVPIVIENRAVPRLLNGLFAPLSGWAIDQQRSCFDNSLGQTVGSPLLTITDDPLHAAGWSSFRFDGEGITARRRPIFERGVLRGYYIDSFYGRKLKRAPTSGWTGNLVFASGKDDLEALCRATGPRALLVTAFIGGNSNSLTGDFSVGLSGFVLENGERKKPVAGMNLAGNHKSFWKKLVALGSDPYVFSGERTPSLRFSAVEVAGK